MEEVHKEKTEEVFDLSTLPKSLQQWYHSTGYFHNMEFSILEAMLSDLETHLLINVLNDNLNLTTLTLLYSAFQKRLSTYNLKGEEDINSDSSLTPDMKKNILKVKSLMKQVASAKSVLLSKAHKTHREAPHKAHHKAHHEASKAHKAQKTHREAHHEAPLNISQESELIATQIRHILVDSHLRTFGTLSANDLMTREQFNKWVSHAEELLFDPPKR
jgi:hypothetical protein